jgi:Tfp pilus assembly protein PilO
MAFLTSLPKKDKAVLALAGGLALLGILYALVFKPFSGEWFNLGRDIRVKEAELRKGMNLLQNYEAIKSEYERYASLKRGSQSDEQLMAGMLAEIENLARKSSVSINALKPYGIKDMGLYRRFLAHVELDTTVGDLSRFLYEIQNSPKILKIENIDINARPEEKTSIKAQVVISRVVFSE